MAHGSESHALTALRLIRGFDRGIGRPTHSRHLAGVGFARGDLLALAISPGTGLAVARPDGWSFSVTDPSPVEVVRHIEQALRPRWVLWGSDTATALVSGGVRIATCWHIAAVQRLLVGGWRTDPARIWAELHDLTTDELPVVAAVDLFTEADDREPDEPLRPDGYLEPEWLEGDFEWTTARLARWAQLAARVAVLQDVQLVEAGRSAEGTGDRSFGVGR